MTWLEWLNEACGGTGTCFATATTGLSMDGTLIAVAISKMDGTDQLLVRNLPEEAVLPSKQYHGIDGDVVARYGQDQETFERAVRLALVSGGITYNVKFQAEFLEPIVDVPLIDITIILKAAESGLMLPREVTTNVGSMMSYLMERMHLRRFPIKEAMARRDINMTPPAGILPVEHNAACLRRLAQKLDAYELRVS